MPKKSKPAATQPDQTNDTFESSINQSSSIRDALFVIIVLVAVVAILWVLFSGRLWHEKANLASINGRELPSMLLEARRRLDAGHLSVPYEGSALSVYLEALEYFPDSSQAYAGVEAVGERYFALLDELLKEQEIDVAKRTLRSLENVAEHLNHPEFDARLADASASINETEEVLNAGLKGKQSAVDRDLVPYQVFRDPMLNEQQGPAMVFLPGGTITIGSPPADFDKDSDETPQYQATLKAFAIGQTEVSFAQYDAYAKAMDKPLPDDNGWGRGDLPVINISWLEAKAYTRWLTTQTGFRYRLPTEAEWEYAARANTDSRFAHGACLSPDQENFDDRELESVQGCPSSGRFEGKTLPISTLQPNPWGLYDVHGNVREWTEDCWDESYRSARPDGSPVYLLEGGKCSKGGRVLRGGAWSANMRSARPTNRFAAPEDDRSVSFGFRLARDIYR